MSRVEESGFVLVLGGIGFWTVEPFLEKLERPLPATQESFHPFSCSIQLGQINGGFFVLLLFPGSFFFALEEQFFFA